MHAQERITDCCALLLVAARLIFHAKHSTLVLFFNVHGCVGRKPASGTIFAFEYDHRQLLAEIGGVCKAVYRGLGKKW